MKNNQLIETIQFDVNELLNIQKARLASTITNGWLNGNKFDTELEWKETISECKGKIQAYEKIIHYLNKNK